MRANLCRWRRKRTLKAAWDCKTLDCGAPEANGSRDHLRLFVLKFSELNPSGRLWQPENAPPPAPPSCDGTGRDSKSSCWCVLVRDLENADSRTATFTHLLRTARNVTAFNSRRLHHLLQVPSDTAFRPRQKFIRRLAVKVRLRGRLA
jgi:hypothetical protein